MAQERKFQLNDKVKFLLPYDRLNEIYRIPGTIIFIEPICVAYPTYSKNLIYEINPINGKHRWAAEYEIELIGRQKKISLG